MSTTAKASPYARAAARDATGKVHTTSFSTRKYTPEEVAEKIKGWKAKIKALGGVPPKPAETPLFSEAKILPETKTEAPSNFSDAKILPEPKKAEMPVSEAKILPAVPLELLESRPFALDLPKDAFTVAILASSRAGKTTVISHLFREMLRKHITILVAPHSFADAYASFKPDRNLVRAQELYPELLKAAHKLQKKSKMAFRLCFILDDFADRDDKNARSLFLNMRNAKISTILATQSPKLLAKSARGSVNWLLFGRFNSDEQIRDAVDTFLSSYLPGKMEEKIALYRQLTSDYHWLALDQLNDRLVRLKPAPR